MDLLNVLEDSDTRDALVDELLETSLRVQKLWSGIHSNGINVGISIVHSKVY
jgi:hypothetical protein